MNTTEDPKAVVALAFHAALAKENWEALRRLVADDATWTLPGNNTVSGRATGGDQVVARARKLASYGVQFALDHILVGRDNFALSLHNTGRHDGAMLDEKVAIVGRLRGGLIAELETYLSDVDGMNAFFA